MAEILEWAPYEVRRLDGKATLVHTQAPGEDPNFWEAFDTEREAVYEAWRRNMDYCHDVLDQQDWIPMGDAKAEKVIRCHASAWTAIDMADQHKLFEQATNRDGFLYGANEQAIYLPHGVLYGPRPNHQGAEPPWERMLSARFGGTTRMFGQWVTAYRLGALADRRRVAVLKVWDDTWGARYRVLRWEI